MEIRSKDIGRGRKLFAIYFRLGASVIFLVGFLGNPSDGPWGLEAISYDLFVCSGLYKKF